ncbi:hypothetical protein FRC17_006620 [Serendipita sp. 399]|nr:hypothetical protein FRC17_006620 [Serendipita sp. 399]
MENNSVTINALVIFAISRPKENRPQSSTDGPVASDKCASHSSPVMIFREKIKRSRSKPDIAFGQSPSTVHFNGFLSMRDENSNSSLSTIGPPPAIPRPHSNVYDYLSKGQIHVVEGGSVTIAPTGGKLGPISPDNKRLSAAYEVERQDIQGNGGRSLIGHGRRGSSRQLLDTFPKPQSNAEDLEIQVTIITEHTPTDDSPLSIANTRVQGV